MENKNIRDLGGFQSFMLSFNPNVYYDENGMTLEDEAAVKNFIESIEGDKENYEYLLGQCREVLAMDPFPWEEVADLCEIGVWDEEKQDYVGDNPILYKQWLEKVTNMLEAEAKKRGLL